MARRGKKIVIVGGGSTSWTPGIVKDMLLTRVLAGSAFVLYDTNREAADLVAAFLTKLDAGLHTGSSFVATDNREKAFVDADYFIITISTGGLSAMAHDLALSALRLDPACARLTGDEVRELGTRLIAAHRPYTEGLFSRRVDGRGGSWRTSPLYGSDRPLD